MPATGCPGGRPPFPGRSSALSWAGDPGHMWLGRLPPPSVLMGAKAQAPQLCTCCGLSALCQRGGLGYCPDQPPCRTVFTPTSAHTRSGSDNAEAMSASGRVSRAPTPICSLTRDFLAGNLCSRAHGKPSHSRSGDWTRDWKYPGEIHVSSYCFVIVTAKGSYSLLYCVTEYRSWS